MNKELREKIEKLLEEGNINFEQVDWDFNSKEYFSKLTQDILSTIKFYLLEHKLNLKFISSYDNTNGIMGWWISDNDYKKFQSYKNFIKEEL